MRAFLSVILLFEKTIIIFAILFFQMRKNIVYFVEYLYRQIIIMYIINDNIFPMYFRMIKKISEECYIEKYFYYISIRYTLNYRLLFISNFFLQQSCYVKYVLLKINLDLSSLVSSKENLIMDLLVRTAYLPRTKTHFTSKIITKNYGRINRRLCDGRTPTIIPVLIVATSGCRI